MTNDLVSIIIPVYNVAPYLDRCVQSACTQTYKNIEIILIDDGSTDESGEKCDHWAEKDSRIVVVHQKNSGVSAARNTGLDIANGKYISFLDSDDEFIPYTIERALCNFTVDTDLVSFGYNIVNSDNKSKIIFDERTYYNQTEHERINFIVGTFFSFKIGWGVWCNIFLKSNIDKYRIRFQIGHKMTEDKIFCLCYLSHCKKINVISDCLYNYYMRESSITHISDSTNTLFFGEKVELSKGVLQHFKSCDDTILFVENYPLIHYFIFEAEIKNAEKRDLVAGLRKRIMQDIGIKSDEAFFLEKMKDFSKKAYLLKQYYSFIQIEEKKGRAKWLLTGHSFWYTVLVKIRKMLFV